jgi:cytochrome d ubiquinol oxidase subunit II
MLYFVVLFLWISMLIYLLMGGADFGAGILELFFRKKYRSGLRANSYQAIGPIWEANHMWLIIAVVILFVGFPNVYATVSVFLHIPILIMLLGIIARGTSFTFRHYDAVEDKWQAVYNRIFAYSSFITPLFLGIIAGSVVSRFIDTQATDFAAAYIYSWMNWFSITTGLFTVAVCGFLAAIFLSGEVKDAGQRKSYLFQAKVMIWAMFLCAVMVFAAAEHASVPLRHWIFGTSWGLLTVMLALAGLLVLWIKLNRGSLKYIRFLAGFIITLLLIAVSYAHFPDLILLKNGHDLSLLEQDTPATTIHVLGLALIFGGTLILPSLVYLVYSFHKEDKQAVS